MSSYFVFCYVGLSLPVVGVGAMSQLAGLAAATAAFAALIAALAIAAALLGARLLPKG